MKIRHYVADDINILSLQFREDIAPDYGKRISPGITLHFADREEGIVPIFLEIEQWDERPLDHVEFERVNESGERLDEPEIAEILNIWNTLPPKARRSIGEKIREAGKASTAK